MERTRFFSTRTLICLLPATAVSLLCALLLTLLSVAVTVLSGNVFATMMPILGLIAGGYLIVDAIRAAVRARRLKRKWSAILSGSEETGREEDGHVAA